ncbi:MAG: VWA domain-containing protein [Verrucomicrobiales bacterium]|nr:VWA domain-containing protein [Verrucomicrobiales bacterium]
MEFTTFQPLLWLLLLLAMGAGLWFSLVDRPSPLKFGSFALRMLGIILLVLALCRPYWKDRSDELHVVFLVDVSQSIDLASAISATEEIQQAITALDDKDSWSLFAVAESLRAFDSPDQLADLLKQWQDGIADDQFRSASNISTSSLNSRLAFPAGKSRRIVLFSDGMDTQSNSSLLSETLATLKKEKVDVQFKKLEGLKKSEAAVLSITPSSPFAYQGEVMRMQVQIASNQAMKARLRILHKGVAVREINVALKAQADNRFNLDVDMTTPGASVWTAEILPEKDFFPINNQLATTVTVKGKPRLLFLHQKPTQMRPFLRSLREQSFEVDVRGNHGLPESMDELLAFDAIVLADVPATDMSVRQMQLLRKYVADFGGGLAMFGSDNSFGLGGYYKTPVEEVLPLTSRFEKEKEKPSLAMVLVIDKSGSMSGQPIALARQAAKAAVELLSARDQIAVIGFDSQPQVISEMRSAGERAAVQSAIDSLEAGGGTDVYPSMALGREMLESASAKVKHMIILSDGQTQPADHIGLAQTMADAGITVSTVALGQGAAKELMASIAEVGNGRYYETNDPASVPQIFTKETMQASKSAIKEDLYGTVQSGDHPMMSGYEETELPFSLGYVMTEAKPTAQVLLLAETGDPLLAVSRFGLGTGMAYTSDLTEKWGGEWLAWEGCGKFWAQAFRSIVRKSDSAGLRTKSKKDQQNWIVDIRSSDPDHMPVSRIDWDGALLDANGKSRPVKIEETGLGRYRATIPLSKTDKQLSLRLHDRSNDKLKVLHYSTPYPAEYRLASKLPDSVAKLPPFDATKVRDQLTPTHRHRSVMHWFAFAGLACLLAGMMLRRI